MMAMKQDNAWFVGSEQREMIANGLLSGLHGKDRMSTSSSPAITNSLTLFWLLSP